MPGPDDDEGGSNPKKKKDDDLVKGLYGDDDDDLTSDDDKDSSESEAEESDGYGPDFMGYGEEKDKLMAMPEAKREEIIYNRQEERKQKLERKAAKNREKERQRKKPTQKTRKSRRDVNEKLKRERQEWAEELAGYKEKLEKNKRRENRKKADESPEDEEEEEYKDQDRMEEEEEELSEVDDEVLKNEIERKSWIKRTPIDLKAIQDSTVRRNHLEALISKPYFEEFVKGKFVKVAIGGNGGRQVYRLCRIVAVVNGENNYQITKGGRTTRKKLLLSMGKQSKAFRLLWCSNQSVDERLLQQWLGVMEKDGLSDEIPSKEELYSQLARAKKLQRNYTTTHDDIEKLVAEREDAGYFGNVIMRIGALKFQIQNEEDEDKRKELKRKLKKLEKEEERERQNAAYSTDAESKKLTERLLKLNQEKQINLSRLKKRRKVSSGNANKLDPFERNDTRSTGLVLGSNPDDKIEDSKKEQKKTEEKNEKDILSEYMKKALENNKLHGAEGKSRPSKSDPYWEELKKMCSVVPLKIDANKEHKERKPPEPPRLDDDELKNENITSLQEYLDKLEEEEGR
mmetsp:Transcript_1430/g.3256  ORF Transcript_1430/g.3256 Transcript_1430/m.3256 type:complete len:571 (+) Transcript_1430:116-1828(+)|eukprot:CAMPEP_0114524926 /NCGR_PEP_ID=MMETSP0109-20121206/22126_1 /TAXON_ID=29199 /ORGANISM="Chlorarachnion reptans, Strain CCCM449" /LENGTH=570 /DNA_ID=CAMNT_0001706423 /DNA_START=96 /DNA_END=1811 /DNA_ORIENTATION=-